MRRLLLLLTLLFAGQALAAPGVRQFSDGEAVTVRPDTAYLLFRTDAREMEGWFDFILVRETAAPGEAAPPGAPPRLAATGGGENVVRTDSRDVYTRSEGSRFFLLAVPAGSYVIAGVTYKRMNSSGTCLCMGTLRFEAKPGAVTDLGHFLAALEDKPTAIPELAGFTNPPTKYQVAPALAAMTVRPPNAGLAVPEALQGAAIHLADYRAVGKFPNYFRTMINRMAPVEGVLGYDRDVALDLKSGAR